VNLDTERGHVLLLELASQVALDEGGLDTAPNWSACNELRRHTQPRQGEREGGAEQAAAGAGDVRDGSDLGANAASSDAARGEGGGLTLPVPPSPTRTNLKVGIS